MGIFGKLEINFPLLHALKLSPLSNFVKDFIARKTKDDDKIMIGENVSAVIQKKLPSKCKDPETFSLPIWIGNTKVNNVLCDLGASINVMPPSLYHKLTGAQLVETRVVIQLADISCIYPTGMLENMLVKVHNFVYPTDSYLIKMGEYYAQDSSGVLLKRPFLSTVKTVINVCDGTICLDYHGEKVTFSIDNAMKGPMDTENVNFVDVLEPLAQEHIGVEFIQDKEFEGFDEVVKKAASMFELFTAQGLSDEEISSRIDKWCKGPTIRKDKEPSTKGLAEGHLS